MNPVPITDLCRTAQLVDSLYRPITTTLAEALDRWQRLEPARQSACYMVIEGDEPSFRPTLNGAQIAMLAAHSWRWWHIVDHPLPAGSLSCVSEHRPVGGKDAYY